MGMVRQTKCDFAQRSQRGHEGIVRCDAVLNEGLLRLRCLLRRLEAYIHLPRETLCGLCAAA